VIFFNPKNLLATEITEEMHTVVTLEMFTFLMKLQNVKEPRLSVFSVNAVA
jgi:hypothetical protein